MHENSDNDKKIIYSRLYQAAGVTVGLAEGITKAELQALSTVFNVVGHSLHNALLTAEEAIETWAERTILSAYVAVGACAGILAGSKYAVQNLKVWLLDDDDIALQLIGRAPSPIKYSHFPPNFQINLKSDNRYLTDHQHNIRRSMSGSSRSSPSISPRAAVYERNYTPLPM